MRYRHAALRAHCGLRALLLFYEVSVRCADVDYAPRQDLVGVAHLPHAEVALAYNAAAIFVYPSSYEGFGMPVLEAMACGTPVIALHNTAFPEFAGGVAKLLPNAEVETLHAGIEGVLGDASLRAEMAGAGPNRAADYAWPIVARQYIELLTRLATKTRSG